MSIQLRDYQTRIAMECYAKLQKYRICYLSMEVRTGKTLTSLAAADFVTNGRVLFLTKKKAISSIEDDYRQLKPNYELVVINNESMHKVEGDFDLIISDEHHRNGAYPKPNKGTKIIKEKYSHLPMIFLSGTPYPESYSQVYHQYWVSDRSPFKSYINFYKWAKDYVNVTQQRRAGGFLANDYSAGKKDKIIDAIKPTMITYTQSEAGFKSEIKEKFLLVDMSDKTHSLIKRLKKDKVIVGSTGNIVADTELKLMQKVHQLASGTCKLDTGKGVVIDNSKAIAIRDKFKNNKIGIFYKFKAELDCLVDVFGDSITQDLDEFNSTDKHIALQIVSGREGISLRNADYIVYFNIDFSAISYWQSRDRMTTMDRQHNEVYWVFSDVGIEKKIYKAVENKKDYTLSVFRRDNNITYSQSSLF